MIQGFVVVPGCGGMIFALILPTIFITVTTIAREVCVYSEPNFKLHCDPDHRNP